MDVLLRAVGWAQERRPSTALGWLALASAAGAATCALSVAIIVALIVAWCAGAALLAITLVFDPSPASPVDLALLMDPPGVALGAWLCLTAWVAVAFAVVSGCAAIGLWASQAVARIVLPRALRAAQAAEHSVRGYIARLSPLDPAPAAARANTSCSASAASTAGEGAFRPPVHGASAPAAKALYDGATLAAQSRQAQEPANSSPKQPPSTTEAWTQGPTAMPPSPPLTGGGGSCGATAPQPLIVAGVEQVATPLPRMVLVGEGA
ncbi:hypothetical protein TSOC_002096 [Tetrabaena socialis]|uniref:Uncharacterized protein n=1 Tax=Tetrabaena socialis TaxID=47790 RepID=A0A2J8AF09_9CHLO|nr:hypothetical protein TSOC_002096 [Tetrabaena socialis]|eukprot:PNH11108.1 hypothetical protein TSOC_002096 [Tetrabaena socialis]